jgi:hypothetical protein
MITLKRKRAKTGAMANYAWKQNMHNNCGEILSGLGGQT